MAGCFKGLMPKPVNVAIRQAAAETGFSQEQVTMIRFHQRRRWPRNRTNRRAKLKKREDAAKLHEANIHLLRETWFTEYLKSAKAKRDAESGMEGQGVECKGPGKGKLLLQKVGDRTSLTIKIGKRLRTFVSPFMPMLNVDRIALSDRKVDRTTGFNSPYYIQYAKLNRKYLKISDDVEQGKYQKEKSPMTNSLFAQKPPMVVKNSIKEVTKELAQSTMVTEPQLKSTAVSFTVSAPKSDPPIPTIGKIAGQEKKVARTTIFTPPHYNKPLKSKTKHTGIIDDADEVQLPKKKSAMMDSFFDQELAMPEKTSSLTSPTKQVTESTTLVTKPQLLSVPVSSKVSTPESDLSDMFVPTHENDEANDGIEIGSCVLEGDDDEFELFADGTIDDLMPKDSSGSGPRAGGVRYRQLYG